MFSESAERRVCLLPVFAERLLDGLLENLVGLGANDCPSVDDEGRRAADPHGLGCPRLFLNDLCIFS